MSKYELLPQTPFYVAFEVISSCNLNCIYCYAKPFTGYKPLLEQLEYLFYKTRREAQPFEVNILGGEPFLRDDIIDVLKLAKDAFKWVGVSTNGTLIPKLSHEQMVELRQLNRNGLNIQVSLDSHIKNINDSLRGGFNDTVRGLERLDEYNIEFEVGIVVTRLNANHITDTVKWIITKFRNVKRIHLMNVMPSYTLTWQDYKRLSLGAETANFWKTIVPKLSHIKKLRSDVEIDYPLTPNAYLNASIDTMRTHKLCLAGITRANVLANGDVTPCELVRSLKLGNLYRESWPEIWERSKKIIQKINTRIINNSHVGVCALVNLKAAK